MLSTRPESDCNVNILLGSTLSRLCFTALHRSREMSRVVQRMRDSPSLHLHCIGIWDSEKRIVEWRVHAIRSYGLRRPYYWNYYCPLWNPKLDHAHSRSCPQAYSHWYIHFYVTLPSRIDPVHAYLSRPRNSNFTLRNRFLKNSYLIFFHFFSNETADCYLLLLSARWIV